MLPIDVTNLNTGCIVNFTRVDLQAPMKLTLQLQFLPLNTF